MGGGGGEKNVDACGLVGSLVGVSQVAASHSHSMEHKLSRKRD